MLPQAYNSVQVALKLAVMSLVQLRNVLGRTIVNTVSLLPRTLRGIGRLT